MKASQFVEQYRKLEDHASELETVAEDYKSRAETDRWEQCRIAHEAVESGGFSRASFATAVGKSPSTIKRQYLIWEAHGGARATQRPTYAEAYNEVMGRPGGAEGTIHRVKGGVRNLPPEDKREAFRELADDPDVAEDLGTRVSVARSLSKAEGRQKHHAEREEQSRSKGLRVTTELMQAISLTSELEDKAARIGRIWREHSAHWSEEERQTFRDSWAQVVTEVEYTTAALANEAGWDSALDALVNQEG